jgi:Ca2+/H+ antiporter, TMEM165/GDT1 family
MDAFLISLGSISFAEIGDKSQLLSFFLAARLRKPIPILLGIFLGNISNHVLSVEAGELVGRSIPLPMLRWLVGFAFAAIALWLLVPDRLDESDRIAFPAMGRLAVFFMTTVSYFLAEIGDKTEITTIVLGARFETLLPVVLGSAVGATMADLPVVLGGCWIGRTYAPTWARYVAATIFCCQAALILTGLVGA